MAKILVVDDAAFMRLRAAKLLVEAGHQVLEAENGRLAVEMYLRERPDCVLMDITMPEMDGLEALAEIRSKDPHARIAMLTAMGQQAIVMDAIKRGARDFVVKPFAPDRVLAARLRRLPVREVDENGEEKQVERYPARVPERRLGGVVEDHDQ